MGREGREWVSVYQGVSFDLRGAEQVSLAGWRQILDLVIRREGQGLLRLSLLNEPATIARKNALPTNPET